MSAEFTCSRKQGGGGGEDGVGGSVDGCGCPEHAPSVSQRSACILESSRLLSKKWERDRLSAVCSVVVVAVPVPAQSCRSRDDGVSGVLDVVLAPAYSCLSPPYSRCTPQQYPSVPLTGWQRWTVSAPHGTAYPVPTKAVRNQKQNFSETAPCFLL